jgi:phosphoglycolate phosphatase-like HAD superfamily hydrolase
MKYRCIILDHDDTAVDSTAGIHYPAHIETMRQLRPTSDIVTLDGWLLKNFHPGIMTFLRDELQFNEYEMDREYTIWQDYTKTRQPDFYPGFLEIIREYKELGGRVAVVSHSTEEFILRDYSRVGAHDIPEIIYGWHHEEEKRKPSPYPVQRILEKFNLSPDEALIIDDLKPAVLMARSSGVRVAGAGWGHQIPEIVKYMKENCHYYLSELDQLREILF